MTAGEYVDVLDQRRRYLEARIAAKRSVGWDYVYDQRERDSLLWALGMLGQAFAPEPETGECPHPEDKRRDTSVMGQERTFMCFACGATVKGIA